MNQPQNTPAIPLAVIGVAKATDDGNLVMLPVGLEEGQSANLFVPFKILPQLLIALETGGNEAADARIQRFGTKAASDAALGLRPMGLTKFSLGKASNPGAGPDWVLLQLYFGGSYSMDVRMSHEEAAQLAAALLTQSQERNPPDTPRH